MAELSLRKVTKQFGAVTALSDIDLEIAHREFVVIVGPSGCGKSTLLRVIAGLEQLTTGEIYVGGEAVHRTPAAKRGLAMVFQNYALYPHKTVAQNMGFALRMAKTPKSEIDSRVNQAARILQIEDLLERKPRQLSGGQRQRVAIGRAIVREPKVFLFDEPLSNLDAALRVDMRVELAKLHNTLNATMIYVTHDQTEAMTMADKIVILRSGKMEQVGSPMELYHRPANAFVGSFIGSPRMNILPTSVTAVADHTVTVELPGGEPLPVPIGAATVQAGDRASLGMRPEHLTVGADGPGPTIAMKVYVTEPLGGETILYGHVGDDQTLVVKVPGELPVATGERVPVHINPASCHLFDDNDIALPRQT
ncbi:MAG: sn-glycerol-3-phosphate ABC transporter ATP-binding protein UgpC [Hyphomicrobiales bacterium]|nr:sn-glycerol-3-phosphate ABC transporter ATP-binding protein UgpC [Hyphomicrobiales bacterium]